MVKFPLHKNSIRSAHIGLGQGNFFCFVQQNIVGRISIFSVARIIIILLYGYNPRGKVQFPDRVPGTAAYVPHKILARKKGTGLQLKYNVLLRAVHSGNKISRFINLPDQLLQDIPAGPSNIIMIRGNNTLPVRIHAGQVNHPALPVICNLNLRIHAQNKASRLLYLFLLHSGGSSASGQKGC